MNLERQRCKHIRSNEPNKVPLPDQLDYGEIAINYASGLEKLYIKNTSDSIVSFSPTGSPQPKDDYEIGCNNISSLSNVPVTKRLVMADIKSNQSFTLSSLIDSGKEIHIIITNTGSKNITISLPTSGQYSNLGATALSLKPQEIKEINIISDGKKVYIRTS